MHPDQLRLHAANVIKAKDIVKTEEATKNAMVMPLITLLGYNVFDPTEVTPELIADIGIKKGEKVDYAILKDGKPIIIFECKKTSDNLSMFNGTHATQLSRYFHVTSARFAVLTNGIVYKFFTDLEEANKMDINPFFEFDVLDFKDRDLEELKKFKKDSFDLDAILNTANDLKLTRIIQKSLSDCITNPTDDFVRIVAKDIIGGRQFRSPLKEHLTSITKRAFEQLIGEKINERLKGAMSVAPIIEQTNSLATNSLAPAPADEIVTTQEEIAGFEIVRAILSSQVNPERIVIRDAKSYCAILLDDNNRKPICRLRFNNIQKLSVVTFDEKKDEVITQLQSVSDLHLCADKLKSTLQIYLNGN